MNQIPVMSWGKYVRATFWGIGAMFSIYFLAGGRNISGDKSYFPEWYLISGTVFMVYLFISEFATKEEPKKEKDEW